MICTVLLFWLTFQFYKVSADGECIDVQGRLISQGSHYVPGPHACSLCICEESHAKDCKAVLCSPPHDCRSFRVGKSCCEFICLDDVVKADGSDATVRLAAGGAAAAALIAVALVAYRVRQQKRRRAPRNDDQRSLTSIGYISGSMAYVSGTCETGLSAWKPPSNYMPRGEAPPPYDEVVAQSRAETMRMSEVAFHRTYPATVEAMPRADDAPCVGHGYVNMRPLQQVPNPQNCYNAPLLQTVHQMETRDSNQMPHHLLASNVAVGFPPPMRLTGSLGAISNRGLLSLLRREPEPERPRHVPGFYTSGTEPMHSAFSYNIVFTHADANQTSGGCQWSMVSSPRPVLHRTIPRISTAIDTTILDTSISGFNRTDRSLQNEIRRSFHKPNENIRQIYTDTGRSMPRNLNLASNSEMRGIEATLGEGSVHSSSVRLGNSGRSRAHSEEQNVSGLEQMPVKSAASLTKIAVGNPPPDNPIPAPQTTLPLTADKPSCVCSYEGGGVAAGEATEDADDYRSECENCKSASSSRWVLEEGWLEEQEDGTQTLQRRAPPPAPPPPATATLPQPVTRPSRTVIGPPSNWENWFNTIPDSDTESEEE